MLTKIQWRRDTAANWTSAGPTLLIGEAGYETDTGKLKIGDGSTAWASLSYYAPGAHKDSHDPNDGSDPLDTAAPAELASVQAAAVGTAHTLARADHGHQIQHSIADNHLVTIDGTANQPVDTDYAKWTASGLEGKDKAGVLSDLNVADGADVTGSNAPQAHKDSHDPNDGGDPLDTAAAAEISVVVAAGIGTAHTLARADHVHAINHAITDNHIATIDGTTNAPADNDYAKFTASGLEGRSYAEVRTDVLSGFSLPTLTALTNVFSNDDSVPPSPFSASIAGNPTATSVVFDGETNESSIGQNPTSGRMYLHNTTRGNSRLIADMVWATNTITTEDTTDDWADNDVITTQSTTNAQAGYFDLDISDVVPATCTAIMLQIWAYDSGGAADTSRQICIHPYETYAADQRVICQFVLSGEVDVVFGIMKVVSQKITMGQFGGANAIKVRINSPGYYTEF